MTPAEAAGIHVKGWKQLIENKQKMIKEIEAKQPVEVKVRV
jgi:hypothetical protein